MENNLEEGIKAVEVLEEKEGDEVDKASTKPQWSTITVISLGISMGMSKQEEGSQLCSDSRRDVTDVLC